MKEIVLERCKCGSAKIKVRSFGRGCWVECLECGCSGHIKMFFTSACRVWNREMQKYKSVRVADV